MTIAEDIFELLDYRKLSTGGHNGYSLLQLKELSGHSDDEIKKVLRVLWDEKKIEVRCTINYKIIRLL